MITLQQFFEVSKYRMSEGSEFGWDCYGPNAYTIDSWNGIHGDGGWSISITFDTVDQTVYDVVICDYTIDNVYRIINPNFIKNYNEELEKQSWDAKYAYDDVEYIDLTIDKDWLEKAKAIVNGESYDKRIQIEIDLSDSELFNGMQQAHKLDITFNEFVNQTLQNFINTKEEVR